MIDQLALSTVILYLPSVNCPPTLILPLLGTLCIHCTWYCNSLLQAVVLSQINHLQNGIIRQNHTKFTPEIAILGT
jgi:hypothetical protein